MNTERCARGHGVLAGVLALLVFAVSVALAPARTDAPVPSSVGLTASASSVLYSPGAPSANAILPAGAALPVPHVERSLPEGPSGTYYAGTPALVGAVALRFPEGPRPVLPVDGVLFPRHVFLHVYRC